MALTLQQNPPQAIACAVQFDDQHCGIYAGDWDSYKDFAEVFDPLIQVKSVVQLCSGVMSNLPGVPWHLSRRDAHL